MSAVVSNTLIESVKAKKVEDVSVYGDLMIRPMVVGDNEMLLEITAPKGAKVPTHKHNHESVGYIVKGELRMIVDGKEYLAGVGSAFRHPEGVLHSTEALEDTVYIEIKSPPMKTW